MINRLQLLRNIGQFDSVDDAANIPFGRLTLVYAENGRGKTTIAAICRSLASGDPIPITERRRLAAQHPPYLVLDCDGGPPPAIFENGAWNRTVPNMVVFDDLFVDENLYSGLAVGAEHRQNLHEIVLGAQGVALNRQLHQLVARVEQHNSALRNKAAAISAAVRGGLAVDDFCALPAHPDIDGAIQDAERRLAAVREQESVRTTPLFETLSLPTFDAVTVTNILHENVAALDADAVAQVRAHLAMLGPGGEAWAGEGMRRLPPIDGGTVPRPCPFCAQDLAGSEILGHYQAYFSAGYTRLKGSISGAMAELDRRHGGDASAAFERAVRVAVERRQFWSKFCDLPDIAIDTAAIVRDWRAATASVASALAGKLAAPLDATALGAEARAALATYDNSCRQIDAIDQRLQEGNRAIAIVKEQAVAGNPIALAGDISRLRATRARHEPTMAPLCDDYLAEVAAKTLTGQQRDQARVALDQYRTNVFPAFQAAVNAYLQLFNAGFRLDNVTSAYTRGGPACSYSAVINNVPVPVAGGTRLAGQPSFRNTLSAGDRNTLALAFFFAWLDRDAGLANKVVVIDDPVSSLDDHRSLTTVQEIRRLAGRAGQVLALSHNKRFLCRVWEGADPATSVALQVTRDVIGSTVGPWNVDADSETEHDRRHARLREYLANGTPNNREVARSIRPTLEAFLRVACPEHFPPGTLLGPFQNLCQQRLGTVRQILSADLTQELGALIEYSNRFHHDTNPGWETEAINDGELAGFVRRALAFAKR